MAEFRVGERFQPRARRLDAPALAGKLLRRRIGRSDVDAVLDDNEVIELYEHDDRVRYVLLGRVAGRPLHVVVAEDDIVGATVVLSVYEPDQAHGWDPRTGFRERMEGRDGE